MRSEDDGAVYHKPVQVEAPSEKCSGSTSGDVVTHLLAGVRIIEFSMLLSAAATTSLSAFGADVVKIDPPGGDPIRLVGPPFAAGTSLLDLHVNQGKRRLRIDLGRDEDRDEVLTLARSADAVVEAMRPGFLERRRLAPEALWAVNPRLVIVRVSGFGQSGPYCQLPTHGTAYDAWGGLLPVRLTEEDTPTIGTYVPTGIQAGSIIAALSLLAGIISARSTGRGHLLEIAHAEAACWFNSAAVEAARLAHSDGLGVEPLGDLSRLARHQVYETSDDRLILLMAPEDKLWGTVCAAIDRPDLRDRRDAAAASASLRKELADVFRQQTLSHWMMLASQRSLPLAPVNSAEQLLEDPQFRHSTRWSVGNAGVELMSFPVRASRVAGFT